MKPEEAGLTYKEIGTALQTARTLFTTESGRDLIVRNREKVIQTLIREASDHFDALFTTGYPNYAIPEVGILSSGQVINSAEFQPIAEIPEVVDKTLRRIEGLDESQVWQCPGCYADLKLKSLRPAEHACHDAMHPFWLYSTIPDLDIHMVVNSERDAQYVVAAANRKGYFSAENDLVRSVRQFPDVMNVDFYFYPRKEFEEGLGKIISFDRKWWTVEVPKFQYMGELKYGKMHLGLDFASQMIPHYFKDPELAHRFLTTRQKFVQGTTFTRRVSELIGSQEIDGVPKKTGRFLHDSIAVRANFLDRLAGFERTGRVEAKGYQYRFTDGLGVQEQFDAFVSIAGEKDKTFLFDSSILPFIGTFAPSFIEGIKADSGIELPYRPENLRTEKAVALALAHGALDTILWEGNATTALVKDRFLRLLDVVDYLGLSSNNLRTYIDDLDSRNLEEATYYAKSVAFQLMRLFAKQQDKTVLFDPTNHPYPFVEPLKKIFGDNLENIVMYGSSIYGNKGNDYDLVLLVDHLDRDMYTAINSKQKVINAVSDREAHIIIVPKSELFSFLSVDCIQFHPIEAIYSRDAEEPLYWPVFNMDSILLASIPANKVIRSMHSMQDTFRDPSHYVRKPFVLHGHLKVPKYLIQAYEILHKDALPEGYFDELRARYPIPPMPEHPMADEVKILRNKAFHDLFSISREVMAALNEARSEAANTAAQLKRTRVDVLEGYQVPAPEEERVRKI